MINNYFKDISAQIFSISDDFSKFTPLWKINKYRNKHSEKNVFRIAFWARFLLAILLSNIIYLNNNGNNGQGYNYSNLKLMSSPLFFSWIVLTSSWIMDLLHIWVISATEVSKFHQTMNYLLSYSNLNNRFFFKKSRLAFSCCTDSIVLCIVHITILFEFSQSVGFLWFLPSSKVENKSLIYFRIRLYF